TAASSRRPWRSAQSEAPHNAETAELAERAENSFRARSANSACSAFPLARRAVTRVISGAVLIALAIGVVWVAPPILFLAVALLVAVVGVYELVMLARASGLDVALVPAAFATAIVVAGSGTAGALETCLVTALIAVGGAALGSWRGGPSALATVSASLF